MLTSTIGMSVVNLLQAHLSKEPEHPEWDILKFADYPTLTKTQRDKNLVTGNCINNNFVAQTEQKNQDASAASLQNTSIAMMHV